jgi:archaellum component FlaC
MANPEWGSADTDQKLEMLRDDIRRLFSAVSDLVADIRNIHDTLRQGDPMLSEVAKAVEKIEGHLALRSTEGFPP